MRQPVTGPALATALVLLCSTAPLLAAADVKCSATSKCPRELPCCFRDGLSESPGDCGTGRSCTFGCDPLWSFSPGSCAPNPGCVNKTYRRPDLDGVIEATKWLGDASASQFSWVGKQPLDNYTDRIPVPLYPDAQIGTQLSLTRYMLFGTVKARLKIAEGVTTSLILLSDTGDYIRINLTPGVRGAGYYGFQSHRENIGNGVFLIPPDANITFYDYEISWQPSQLALDINGSEVINMSASLTWNDTDKRNHFPQTPARFIVQVARSSYMTNASSDLTALGYDFAAVSDITIECSGTGSATLGSSYSYADNSSGTNDSVIISNKPTILNNQSSTGLDLAAQANDTAADLSADSSSGGLLPGAKAGIAVGVVVAAVLAVALLVWYRRRKRKQEASRVVQGDAPPTDEAAAAAQFDNDTPLHSQKAELDTTEIARHELPDPSPSVGPTGPAELLGDLVHSPRVDLDTKVDAVESQEKGITPVTPKSPPDDEAARDAAIAAALEKKLQKDLEIDTAKTLAVSVGSAQPSPVSAMAVSPASKPEEIEKIPASLS